MSKFEVFVHPMAFTVVNSLGSSRKSVTNLKAQLSMNLSANIAHDGKRSLSAAGSSRNGLRRMFSTYTALVFGFLNTLILLVSSL